MPGPGRDAPAGHGCSSGYATSTCSNARTAAAGRLRIIAAIVDRSVVEKILSEINMLRSLI